MAYATRSRATAQTRSTAPSARSMGDSKPVPKKKRPSSPTTPLTRRRHSVTKDTPTRTKKKNTSIGAEDEEKDVKTTSDGGVLTSIETNDEGFHGGHALDGKEHHLVEQDGRDHHHIFFEDFEKSTTHGASGEMMDVDANSDVYTLRDGHQVHHGVLPDAASGHHDAAPAAQPRERRERRASTTKPSSSLSSAHTNSRTGPAPLVIHVDHTRRKHSLDGVDHHIIEADGRDHHHIRYEDSEESAPAPHASDSGALPQATSPLASHKVAKKSAHSTAGATSHEASSSSAAASTTTKPTVTKRRGSVPRSAVNNDGDTTSHQAKTKSATHKPRESGSKTVQSPIKGLENANATQSKKTQELILELVALKEGMQENEKELKACRVQIHRLEGEHAKVLTLSAQLKNLRTRLSEREVTLKGLKKENRSLNKDHIKVEKLTGEVASLTQEILEAEDMLRKAQSAVDGLVGYRDRAATLEVEVHDLRDQVNIHEKHETDLENALMSHEDCAMESQQLEETVNLLQKKLNEKQSEIQALQSENATDESKIAQLQREVSALQAEMATHDLAAEKLREKASKDLAKIKSTAGTLRMEVTALRQQLKGKNAELKQHDKSNAQRLGQVQSQNSALTDEIQKLERLIETKDRHAEELDSVIANMSKHAERAYRLEGQVLQLQQESQRVADKSAKDLSALVAELREQLKDTEKEAKEQIRVKEDVILELQKQLSSLAQNELAKTHEIGRLNTVVSQSRSELLTDHQRRASEIEESVLAKGALESQISDDHQPEMEMEGQMKALVAWKQNAIAHCDMLTLTITKLEKEVRLLKGVVTQRDKDDANAQAHLENLRGQVQSLENAKVMLQREVEKKDAMIEELEEMLREKTKEAKRVAIEARKETATTTRTRMDSGAFLEHTENTTTVAGANTASTASAGAITEGSATTVAAH
ncbi:hypothetical protein BG015_011979 [Linnemannia schmuckeri]|uniref:Uncharacterized protein n=1 Tax=Linnemannia schmuckeri TaxID=64567 RepID=A0A9P5S863_9FUNG|nr:hypothetical protein BG015_011979 [Linnemannia schmuckeri]